MSNHLPTTIRIGSVAVTIFATNNGLYVKCIDHLTPEKAMGSPAKDLDEGYRIAATLLKQLLKDQIDEEVDRTISQHLSDCLE